MAVITASLPRAASLWFSSMQTRLFCRGSRTPAMPAAVLLTLIGQLYTKMKSGNIC